MGVKQIVNEMLRSGNVYTSTTLLTAMQDKGISQVEIAVQLGINRRTVKKILTGRKIDRRAAQRAAFALGISLTKFEILGDVRDDFEQVKCKYFELRELLV